MFAFYAKDTKKLRREITPGYQGVDSFRVYYRKFKNIDKELEEEKEGYSATTAYLSKIRSLKVLPPPLGLIHHSNNSNLVSAKNMKLGKSYGLALSNSLKFLQNTQVIELPGNRLGDKCAAGIMDSLVDWIKKINMDEN